MSAVLSKPVDEIGVADIQELIDSEVPEGEQIEFKEALSTKDGSPDRWVTGADKIGDRARNEILEEAVAFANAYAGILALGIAESRARPRVAARICPIPRCVDLAERLKQVFGHCVEPQIPSLEIFAVPFSGDSGVVIIRVGQSRMAPHRVRPTRECTIRRADRCEKMTMREIQDLTLNTSRGLERLERRLSKRAERFEQEFLRLSNLVSSYGIRITAAPALDELRFGHVYGRSDLYTPEVRVSLLMNPSRRSMPLNFPGGPEFWRPRLRSARSEYGDDGSSGREVNTGIDHIYWEIHSDGLVEIAALTCANSIIPYRLCPDWPVKMFSIVAAWADRIRGLSSAPAMEYALSAELYVKGHIVSVCGYNFEYNSESVEHARISPSRLHFPIYSLSGTSIIGHLTSDFERDFWNLLGVDFGKREFMVETV